MSESEVLVRSSEVVKRRGIYTYSDHVDKTKNYNCTPSEKEKNGRILVDGLEAPGLGCCMHEIKWSLKKELSIN